MTSKPAILYMDWSSPPSRSVLLVAAAIGHPLENVIIDCFTGDHTTPEYLKKNPQHTIPMLQEEDFILWDSHAIAAYLVGSYGKNDELYPKDLKRRAIIDQRLHFDCSVLFPSLGFAFSSLYGKGLSELPEDAKQKIIDGLEILEKFFTSEWIAGDTLTIADLCCLATVTSLGEFIPISKQKFPKIIDWIEKCKKLPYYEEANARGCVELGEMISKMLVSK